MSSTAPPRSSISIDFKSSRVLVATVLTLVIISGCSEALARNESIKAALPREMIIGPLSVSLKLADLDRLVEESGPPDCVFVGSSMVAYGVNSEGLSQGYQQTAGEPFRCFNFGIPGLNALGAARLATVLSARYHPRLIVFGCSYRDLAKAEIQLNYPYFHYYMGNVTPEGWLEVNSHAYRYGLRIRESLVSRSPFEGAVKALARDEILEAPPAEDEEESDPPGTNNADLLVRYGMWTNDYRMRAEELEGLDKLLSLDSPDQRILLVDMPFAPGTYEILPNGVETHQTFLDEVRRRADAHGVQVWETQDAIDFADTEWLNAFHLNSEGAKVFGEWFGKQLADAVQTGRISLPTR